MKINSKKIVYFARIDKTLLPGIFNKVQQTTNAFNEVGYEAKLVLVEGSGDLKSVWQSMWKMFFALITTRADIIIVRIDIFMMLLSMGLLWQRIRGCKIIAEVPSPIGNWIEEVGSSEGGNKKRRILKSALICISFPWSLYPAHKIIQYAPESWYFSLGVKNKIHLLANGIDVKNFPKRVDLPKWPDKKFVMIGVASFAKWHGFDRIMIGIAKYLNGNRDNKVTPIFIVVGDGPIRKKWESLCADLNISDYVSFTGFKTGAELNSLYEVAHIAISSLGLYSIGLEMASTLKSREYAARGIPFVKAGADIDFNPTPEFLYEVENNETSVDIDKLIEWYEALNYNQKISDSIRRYAENRLSFVVKARELIG